MSTLKVGGQCEGFGGIFEALRTLLPVEHAWYAEIDENASMVLARRYPGTPNLGDITTVDWTEVERAGRADGGLAVLTAGWPCQPFSQAGKRLGADDERHLWPTGVVPAIRALMPPLFIGENVRGLLTIENGQVFAQVLADLDALGYAVSWTTVGACKVGACHHRHRVFLAATLVEVQAPMSDPIAHRTGSGWGPAQFVLFGDAAAVKWPASGFTAAGTAWELPSDTCGNDGLSLPTPRAIDGEAGQQTLVNGRTVGDRGPRLGDIGALLPTPAASDGSGGAQDAAKRRSGGHAVQLIDAVYSLLPTPRVSDTNGAGQHGNGGPDLRTAVAMLPTPLAQDAIRHRVSPGDLARKSPALEACVALLPTPTATPYGNNQSSSAGAAVRPSLDAIAQLLPTPTVADSRGTRDATAGRSDTASDKVNSGWTLSDVVHAGHVQSLLPTPRVSDGEKGVPNQRGSSGDVMLPVAVQPERFGKYAAAVHRHETAYGLIAPNPTEPGRNGKPRLSAAFPEFMQGLPPGWLTDVVDRKAALKLAGNGVNPRQAAYALPTLPTFTAAVKALAARNEAIA